MTWLLPSWNALSIVTLWWNRSASGACARRRGQSRDRRAQKVKSTRCSAKIKMSHFSKVEMSPESSRKRLPSLMSGVHPTGRKLVKDASGGMFYAERIGLKTVSMAISERGYPAEWDISTLRDLWHLYFGATNTPCRRPPTYTSICASRLACHRITSPLGSYAETT